jgi:energy-coupling factor transporter transmembrane protein EcfT
MIILRVTIIISIIITIIIIIIIIIIILIITTVIIIIIGIIIILVVVVVVIVVSIIIVIIIIIIIVVIIIVIATPRDLELNRWSSNTGVQDTKFPSRMSASCVIISILVDIHASIAKASKSSDVPPLIGKLVQFAETLKQLVAFGNHNAAADEYEQVIVSVATACSLVPEGRLVV